MPNPSSSADIYAPPKANLELEKSYYVEGELLVVRSPAVLPERCVKTASEASVVALSRHFTATGLFRVNILRKGCQITFGIDSKLRTQMGFRLLACRLIFVFGIVVFYVTCMKGILFTKVVGALRMVLAVTAAAACPQFILLKVVKTSGDWFYIKGCSPALLDSIREEQTAELNAL